MLTLIVPEPAVSPQHSRQPTDGAASQQSDHARSRLKLECTANLSFSASALSWRDEGEVEANRRDLDVELLVPRREKKSKSVFFDDL